MTIFDIIAGLLFKKTKNLLTTVDEESVFSPYLVNRWASMYSPAVAIEANKLNKYLGVFENKQDLYKLFITILPKVSPRKIQYFKKAKKEDTEESTNIKAMAGNMEISTRELSEYIAFLEKENNI